MLKPANLFRMMTEFIFILLGGFLIWIGLNNRFLDSEDFHPQRPAWLGVGAALIYWGVRAWVKTSRAASTSERTVARLGGASLALVGLMMLALVAVDFRWAGMVLAAAGGILALRGLLGAVLSLRTDLLSPVYGRREKERGMIKEFKEFAMRGNVLDMAVGIIIGAAFGQIVNSFVQDILMPPIGRLLGHVDFSNLFVSLSGTHYDTIAAAKAAGAATVNYGLFLNTVINFLIVAFAVFLLVRQVNRLAPKPAPVAAPATRDCPYCLSAVPAKATRCPHCTSEIRPA